MRTIALSLLAALLVACAALTPPTGPGTDYPCGVNGVSCGGHMCCGQDEECGAARAGASCPAGMCCFVGPPNAYGARRAPHAQTREPLPRFDPKPARSL